MSRSVPPASNHGQVQTSARGEKPPRTRSMSADGWSVRSGPMALMWRLLGERKGLFAGNLGLRLFKDLLPFQGPILVGIAVDLLSGTDRSMFGIDLIPDDVRSIVIVAIAMAILAVTKTIVGYVHTIVAAHMGRHVVQAARRDLAEASMQMALDKRRRFNSGDLLDRCLADSKGLRSFTQNVVIRVISNTVRVIYPLTLMFVIDPVMAMIVLAIIPLQSTASGLLQRRLQRQTHEARSREASHTSAVKEAIDGWSSVASVGSQDWAAREIHETAAASEDAKIVKKHTTARISAVITLCTSVGIAAVYAVGGWRIISSGALDGSGSTANGALTLGALTTFIGVAKKTYAPFQAYTKIVSSYRTGLVNLERIADVLDAPMLDERLDGPELDVTNGDINVDDVHFTYHDGTAPTLRGLTGEIPGRSMTVITGSSGAGKTTLLRLLLGIDVPDTGTVAIDGQDINVARLASVQKAIALVPQEPMLFSGTLNDNLLLGQEDVSTKELIEACERSGLLDLVRELPKGLDTEVGSGRHMLSGGQLRRMAITRALLRKPAILLLDEPTTGLDEANSTQVLTTLRMISDQTTVVMVSHRRDPLAASDHHLILGEGGWTKAAIAEAETTDAADTSDTSETNGVAPSTHAAGLESGASNGSLFTQAAGLAGDPAVRSVQAVPASLSPVNSNGHNRNGSTNGHGAAGHGATPQDLTPDHRATNRASARVEHRVLALSTMGRPISLNAVDLPDPNARLMLLGGHRSKARPVASIAPGVLAQAASDPQAYVAMASITDLNPDGDWTVGRTTVLGIDLASDHARCQAAETLAFHRALADWNTDLIIDVAEDVHGGALDMGTGQAVDAVIAVRFRPDANGGAPAWIAALSAEIRHRLDSSPFRFGIGLVECDDQSVTNVWAIPVVEITAYRGSTGLGDAYMMQAAIDAAVTTYRSVDVIKRRIAAQELERV